MNEEYLTTIGNTYPFVAVLSHPEGVGHLKFSWFANDRWLVVESHLLYDMIKSEGWEFYKNSPTVLPKDLGRKVWDDLLERGYEVV